MTEHQLAEWLENSLVSLSESGDLPALRSVDDFKSAGVRTNDAGLVVRLVNGSEFQITVVKVTP